MPDNFSASQGTGTTFAADDVSSVLYPRHKIALGADGAYDMDLDSGQQTMANSLPVAIASNQTVIPVSDNSSSLTVDGTVAATQSGTWNVGTVTGVTTVSTLTGGGVAHDAADSGNPVKVGTKAEDALSSVTLVSAGDRADAMSDLDGALLTRSNYALGDLVNGNASNTDGASTSVIAAQGAGIKTYITDITLTNTSSSNIYVELKDGTSVKWTFPVPANSGVTKAFLSPLAGTANTAWNFDPSAATTTVYCSASGFKSKI